MGTQHMGKARGVGGQVGVAQHAALALAPQPDQRRLRAMACGNMPVHRLMRDVQPAAGQARQPRPRRVPAGRQRLAAILPDGLGNDCSGHGPLLGRQ